MNNKVNIILSSLLLLLLVNACIEDKTIVKIDPNNVVGEIRSINGGSLSPVVRKKMLYLGDKFKALNIPIVRLHDAPWFNDDAVDIHLIFRDFRLDPKDESNYDFCKTDNYLASILETGTKVVFRLGESIEKTDTKCYVNPPEDFNKWAEICCGIIRHYNKGWANGYNYDIKYWEIWNEPDGSTATWTGTPEQFYEFYGIVAKRIKSEFPELMIGGPAMAGPLGSDNKEISTSDFTKGFFSYCQENSTPLDFFSWHNYNSDPWDLAQRPTYIRDILDQYGFNNTESHLNEWNYIPNDNWKALFGWKEQGEVRRNAYETQSGFRGAAFVANVLMLLQDKPIDIANFYTTTAGLFGMYSEYGEPHKIYYSFKAFAELLNTPVRIKTDYNKSDSLVICTGKNEEETELNILTSNFSSSDRNIRFDLSESTFYNEMKVEVYVIDEIHDLEMIKEFEIKNSTMSIAINSSSVVLVKLTKK